MNEQVTFSFDRLYKWLILSNNKKQKIKKNMN